MTLESLLLTACGCGTVLVLASGIVFWWLVSAMVEMLDKSENNDQ